MEPPPSLCLTPLSYIQNKIAAGSIESGSILFENIFIGACILALLIFSALMSGSEAALFSLSPKEKQSLKESEDPKSKQVMRLLGDSGKLLGTILQTNNLVNILIVLLTSLLIGRLFDFTGHPVTEFIISTVVVTFLLVLFGEAIPKLMGTRSPVRFSRLTSGILLFLRHFTIPIDKLMNKAVKRFQSSHTQSEEEEEAQKEEALKYLSGAVEMTLPQNTKQKTLLKKILSLPKKRASQIMTPRVDVVTIDMEMSNEEAIKIATECGYSRLPVYKETEDDIRGFLYIKDMLPYILGREQNAARQFDWRKHIREAYFIPGSMKIGDLLEDMRSKKLHLAIVIDEYGGMDGIVTMEDILEEIVGEITDESDTQE